MPIEITGQPGNSAVTRNSGQDSGANVTDTAQQQVPQPTAGAGNQDTVSLTDTASQLQKLENTIAELPVVDSERVDNIRQSIASGNFEIDSARVADKLLNFEQSFGI
jgi:negative regulator of flagellin synthesis FlgM